MRTDPKFAAPWRLALLLLVASLALAGCQSTAATPTTPAAASPVATGTGQESGYPNARLLVDVQWLSQHLDDPAVRVIDMRDPADYAQSHVPGAVNVPVQAIASTINDIPLEFDRDKVQQTLDGAGLMPDMTAVIYDNLGMLNAARFFWTLELVGHQDARVINGGWNAWEAAGYDTSGETPQVQATDYPIQMDPARLVSAEQVLARLDDPGTVIVDARSPQEYSGEVKLAARGGHIPGAVNFVWLDALTGGDAVYTTDPNWQARLEGPGVEVFKPADQIRQQLDDLGITPFKSAITYCQTLWRGAHVYFLLRLMGFDNVSGYDGSWAEWGNRPDLPVATGPEPGMPPAAMMPLDPSGP